MSATYHKSLSNKDKTGEIPRTPHDNPGKKQQNGNKNGGNDEKNHSLDDLGGCCVTQCFPEFVARWRLLRRHISEAAKEKT